MKKLFNPRFITCQKAFKMTFFEVFKLDSEIGVYLNSQEYRNTLAIVGGHVWQFYMVSNFEHNVEIFEFNQLLDDTTPLIFMWEFDDESHCYAATGESEDGFIGRTDIDRPEIDSYRGFIREYNDLIEKLNKSRSPNHTA